MSPKGKLDIRAGLSMVLRAALEHMQGLLRLDPWLPVPQSGCTYTFGSRGRPLPIGALWRILERVPDFGRQCPNCKSLLMPFVFGGVESSGGVKACCIECCRVVYQPMGGVGAVTRLVGPALAGTPFAIAEVLKDQHVIGPREPLWRALTNRGALNLPDESWTEWRDPDEPWNVTVRRNEGEQPEAGLSPGSPVKPIKFWRTVRQRAPRRPPWLCRPIPCPIPLRTITDFEPLLSWGFHEPDAPNAGVAGLFPVPGATEVALWISRFDPYEDHDAIHAVMPPLVTRDAQALREVLRSAFGRELGYGHTIIDAVPGFVRPYTAGGLLDHADWEAILRWAPVFDGGRPLTDRLADIERAKGDPLKVFRLTLARMVENEVEPPSSLPFDAAAFSTWWGLVSTAEAASAYRRFMISMWHPEGQPIRRDVPMKLAAKKAAQFFDWLDDAYARDQRRARQVPWMLHTFPSSWYLERRLPPQPLPVRVSRLAGGVLPEGLPMRALFDDLVDWRHETEGWKPSCAEVLERLGELADDEGDGEGPGPLGALECPHCGRRRVVTEEFLESRAISLEELPQRAMRLPCSRCNGTGARWSGRMN